MPSPPARRPFPIVVAEPLWHTHIAAPGRIVLSYLPVQAAGDVNWVQPEASRHLQNPEDRPIDLVLGHGRSERFHQSA